MRASWTIFITVALLAGAARANPVGMAYAASGGAQYKHGSSWQPLTPMTRLAAGDGVRCPAGGQVAIVLFISGKRYKMAGGTGTIMSNTVIGAQSLGGLSGPSARIAQQLSGARTGAAGARGLTSGAQRLENNFPGWILDLNRTFRWNADGSRDGVASYSFTLFDSADNIVWSTTTTETSVTCPESLSFNVTQPYQRIRPYVWRLTALNATGRPVGGSSKWGIFSVLTRENVATLQSQMQSLEAQHKAAPGDPLPLVLEADLCRQYGVYQKSLEIWDEPALYNCPGKQQAINDLYKEISRYAQALANHIPTDTSK